MEAASEIVLQAQQPQRQAAEALLPLVYDELRRLAQARLAHEKPGHMLQATALVHEAYLRLVGPACQPGPEGEPRPVVGGSDPAGPQRTASGACFEGPGHFFAAAAEAMRRILVENARRKGRIKHGGECERADVDLSQIVCDVPPDDLLALHEALQALAAEDPLKARLVELRYFAGLSVEEAAAALSISERAMEMDPGDSGNLFFGYFLSMARHRLGMHGEARAAFDDANAKMSESSLGNKVLARIRAEAAALLGI